MSNQNTTYISSNEYGEATTFEEDLDRLIKSKPTPEALDEYLLKQMDNPEVDKIPGRETIYIVAGNHAEFEHYTLKKKEEYRRRKPEMREESKPMPLYIYVKDRYTLMGLANIKGYYIGTAFKRKDINQIKQAIEYVKERAELLGNLDTTYTFSQLFATQWDTEDM